MTLILGLPLFALILLFGPAVTRTPDALPVPPMYESERGAIVTYHEGEVWSRSEWNLDHVTRHGRQAVHLNRAGQGRHTDFDEPVRWKHSSFWQVEDGFRPLQSEESFTTLEGKTLLIRRFAFDWDRGQVKYELLDKRAGESRRETIDVPPDTLLMEGLPTMLRALPVGKDKPLNVHVLTNDGKVHEVTFRLTSTETVSLPKGTVSAHRVDAGFDLGLFAQAFAPDITIWVRSDYPNIWVRYVGPGRGGDVRIVQEMSEFEHEGRLMHEK